MLKIRRFVRDKDEELWLRIWNESFKEYEDERAMTTEDMRIWENSPRFDSEGMFIAEWNGKPVGEVYARVDKKREEKKGFINLVGVLPEFRRKGVGRRLVEKGIENLRERGMETVESWTREDYTGYRKLLESMGFSLTRVFSTMEKDLDTIPSTIGENREVKLQTMSKTMRDIKLLNWLGNETFKEHYNFRPNTIEETKYTIENEPDIDINGWFFAYLKKQLVGYVGTGIDKKFIEEKGINRGWIWVIGVLKPHRRKGVGTRLMLAAMEFLKEKGMREAMLGVDDINPTKAIELYKKTGFTVYKKEPIYCKNIK